MFLQRAAIQQRIDETLAREDDIDSSSDDEEAISHLKKSRTDDEDVHPEDVETAEQKKERFAQSLLEELELHSKY